MAVGNQREPAPGASFEFEWVGSLLVSRWLARVGSAASWGCGDRSGVGRQSSTPPAPFFNERQRVTSTDLHLRRLHFLHPCCFPTALYISNTFTEGESIAATERLSSHASRHRADRFASFIPLRSQHSWILCVPRSPFRLRSPETHIF